MTDHINYLTLDFIARCLNEKREKDKVEARKDFNGDLLNIGDEVVFAFAASSLRHGIVVRLPGDEGMTIDRIELRSTKSEDTMKVISAACIKVAV
jgi:hypothetical protein